jgi:glutaredoxin
MKALVINGMKMLIAVCALSSQADLYKWVDENGRTHFSDQKPPRQEPEKLQLQEINAIPTVSVSDLRRDQKPENVENKQVVLYSTVWCGFCKKAAQYFRQNNIPFKEYDVEKSVKGRRDYKEFGGGGVPIILIGKKQMRGFSVQQFERLYHS